MSVMKKMITLLRGSARELGESVVDTNATRVYEQEILDAKSSLVKAKQDLTKVMGQQMQTARQVEKLKSEIERYEVMAVEALSKSQESLAEEVAVKINELEIDLAQQTQSNAQYISQVERLKQLIQQAEAKIRDHERELSAAKTTEHVYRATQSISDNILHGGSHLGSAKESLERIRQRHENLSDQMMAAEQLNNEIGEGALDKKLSAAGIGEDAKRKEAVMARIRARQAANQKTDLS